MIKLPFCVLSDKQSRLVRDEKSACPGTFVTITYHHAVLIVPPFSLTSRPIVDVQVVYCILNIVCTYSLSFMVHADLFVAYSHDCNEAVLVYHEYTARHMSNYSFDTHAQWIKLS